MVSRINGERWNVAIEPGSQDPTFRAMGAGSAQLSETMCSDVSPGRCLPRKPAFCSRMKVLRECDGQAPQPPVQFSLPPIDGKVVDFSKISSRKTKNAYHSSFAKAEPFKHVIIQNLFIDSILDQIVAEFEHVTADDWVHWDCAEETKRGLRPDARLGVAAQAYINAVHSGPFVKFLSDITGIQGLLPDPTLKGGGLHEIPQGGKFGIHIDFNLHPVTKLDNRLVLITYLNRDWKPEFGGALELWSAEERRCVKAVQPVFGRSILFYQSSRSWHGHPAPVNTPDGRSRRSIATYYYTNGRDDATAETEHTSSFLYPAARATSRRISHALKQVTPPIFITLGKRLRQQLR